MIDALQSKGMCDLSTIIILASYDGKSNNDDEVLDVVFDLKNEGAINIVKNASVIEDVNDKKTMFPFGYNVSIVFMRW